MYLIVPDFQNIYMYGKDNTNGNWHYGNYEAYIYKKKYEYIQKISIEIPIENKILNQA